MSNGTEKAVILEALDSVKDVIKKEFAVYVSLPEKMKVRESLYQIMKLVDDY